MKLEGKEEAKERRLEKMPFNLVFSLFVAILEAASNGIHLLAQL